MQLQVFQLVGPLFQLFVETGALITALVMHQFSSLFVPARIAAQELPALAATSHGEPVESCKSELCWTCAPSPEPGYVSASPDSRLMNTGPVTVCRSVVMNENN